MCVVKREEIVCNSRPVTIIYEKRRTDLSFGGAYYGVDLGNDFYLDKSVAELRVGAGGYFVLPFFDGLCGDLDMG